MPSKSLKGQMDVLILPDIFAKPLPQEVLSKYMYTFKAAPATKEKEKKEIGWKAEH